MSMPVLAIIPAHCETVLSYFGIRYTLDETIQKMAIVDEQFNALKFKQHLMALWQIKEKLGEQFNPSLLVDWHRYFQQGQLSQAQYLDTLNKAQKDASDLDTTMTKWYLFFNVISLIICGALALAHLCHGNAAIFNKIGQGTTGTESSLWNALDVAGGMAVGWAQLKQGDVYFGIANISVSSILALGTLGGLGLSIAEFAGAHVSHAATVVNSLFSFSFALCMVTATVIELCSIRRCNQDIAALKAKIEAKDTSTEDKLLFEQMILTIKAKKADHQRAAISWAGCAIAMTAVAFIAVNVFTFGSPLIATAIVSAIAIVSGLIRKYWKDRVSHQKNLETIKGETLSAWFATLEWAYENPADALSEALIAIKDEVSELCHRHPQAAKDLIKAIADFRQHPKDERVAKALYDCLKKPFSRAKYLVKDNPLIEREAFIQLKQVIFTHQPQLAPEKGEDEGDVEQYSYH